MSKKISKKALRNGSSTGSRARKLTPSGTLRERKQLSADTESERARLKALAQIDALQESLPAPDLVEFKADARWLHDQMSQGKLAALAGTHIAVLNKKIVGTGPNALALELQVAREHGVHPDRAVIVWLEPYE